MMVTRLAKEVDKPLLDSLPIGTAFHLGITNDETWLICKDDNTRIKYAVCLETGKLRPLANMTENVSRVYHKMTVE